MFRAIAISVAVCVVLSSFAVTKAYTEGKDTGVRETALAWQREKLDMQSAYVTELEAARSREKELHRQADVLRQEHRNALNNLRTRHAAAIASLQQRPEKRASEASPASCIDSSSGVGSTGKELARPDAEFLVWYATEVEKLQQAYNECRHKYNALRKNP